MLRVRATLLTIVTALTAFTARAEAGLSWESESPQAPSAVALLTRYHVAVNGPIAETRLQQTFLNDSDDWQDAIYRYPLPENAAVHGLEIRIGERVIKGHIEEKQTAARQYEAARQAGQRAALTVQERPNLFRQHVAAIGPGEQVTVTLSFQQPLRYEGKAFALSLPLTYTPRYDFEAPQEWLPDSPEPPDNDEEMPGVGSERELQLQVVFQSPEKLLIHPSISHPEGQMNGNTWSYTGSRNSLNRDFQLSWSYADSAMPEVLASREQRPEAEYLQLTLIPPSADFQPQSLPRDMLWIIDTSGSMQGAPLEYAKAAMVRGLDTLSSDDRFNIISFNQSARKLFAQAIPASPEWRLVGQRRIENLEAGGGTEMARAIDLVFQEDPERLRQVVLMTDGAIGQETGVLQRIATGGSHMRWFPVGIGSAPNRYLIETLAQEGRGSAFFVDSANDIRSVLAQLDDQLAHTLIQNVEVQVTDSQGAALTVDVYPRKLPDLYLDEPLTLWLQLPRSLPTGASVQLSGVVAGSTDGQTYQRWNWEMPVNELPAVGGSQPGVGRAWARAAIDDAERSRFRRVPEAEIRERILPLALAFSLTSRYTSLIAVDETPVRSPESVTEEKLVPSVLPQRQISSAQQGLRLPQTGTGWQQQAWVGQLLLIIGLLLAWLVSRSHQATAGEVRPEEAGAER